ncbi:YchJ family protein [Legionella dresdenensis]|uniref:YchJ family protein n=1 Tax=Legionella dresdenensis TaxID=450200 RepID=A0ABV8CGK1_9GAMM
MTVCPCNSTLDYLACCGLYHRQQGIAPTPEALMRSRYSAYSMANIEYIKQTMSGKPLQGFNDVEAARWASSVVWLGLEVVQAYQDNDTTGRVEFIARYLENDTVKSIHEVSDFQGINGRWYYVGGAHVQEPSMKIARNMPCPCGSMKKFKNCHAGRLSI